MAIIYIETNFMMSIATGREAEAIMLLRDLSSSVQLVIPSICYMEALSALEDELKRQNSFKEQLSRQISETKRDVTSEYATSLYFNLEESLVYYRYRIDEIKWYSHLKVGVRSKTAFTVSPQNRIFVSTVVSGE